MTTIKVLAGAEKFTDAIYRDINGRSGLGLGAIDRETRREMFLAWQAIVDEAMSQARAEGEAKGKAEGFLEGVCASLEETRRCFPFGSAAEDCIRALVPRPAEATASEPKFELRDSLPARLAEEVQAERDELAEALRGIHAKAKLGIVHNAFELSGICAAALAKLGGAS